VIAYKFLRPGGSTIFSGFRWPLPEPGEPGPWVEASSVEPCRSGIHACRVLDLPYWIAPELYELELDGETVELEHKLVATRGRLLRRIEAWDDTASVDYTLACAERARELATSAEPAVARWADIAEATVPAGPAPLGFMAARIAEEIDGTEGYRRERLRQARWLADRLQLEGAIGTT
jgi:hypothetical protein